MKSKYLLASFFGESIGASCVLIVVYVTNTKSLIVMTATVNDAVSSLHSRINDFYIFTVIVITLLLAINVGVFIRADDEVEKHIRENFGKYEIDIKSASKRCDEILKYMEKLKDSSEEDK